MYYFYKKYTLAHQTCNFVQVAYGVVWTTLFFLHFESLFRFSTLSVLRIEHLKPGNHFFFFQCGATYGSLCTLASMTRHKSLYLRRIPRHCNRNHDTCTYKDVRQVQVLARNRQYRIRYPKHFGFDIYLKEKKKKKFTLLENNTEKYIIFEHTYIKIDCSTHYYCSLYLNYAWLCEIIKSTLLSSWGRRKKVGIISKTKIFPFYFMYYIGIQYS